MTLKIKLYRAILLALLECDGTPMPESAVIDAARLLCRRDAPTDSDIADALRDIESGGYASGASVPLEERNWLLTTKGTFKARQMR